MILNKIQLNNFRNLLPCEILPDSKVNIIYGENANGKTNLLEAIWMFSGAKSFRGAKDGELLQFNTDFARLYAEFNSGKTQKNATVEIKARRGAKVFDKKLKSPYLLAQYFHATVFSPQDLSLISGPPEVRRRFLDLCIGSVMPQYIGFLKEYERAITQRGAVIKKIRENGGDKNLLTPFEETAAVWAQKIIRCRHRYVEKLNLHAAKLYNGISSKKEQLFIKYDCKFTKDVTVGQIKEAFLLSREGDIKAGATTVGPKRDDLYITVDSRPAKSFASQGQKRSAAICLKLSEAKIMEEKWDEPPVILLDDVFSELDVSRQTFILNNLYDWQVFITCCDPANITNLCGGKVFKVQKGKICICT